MTELTPGTIVAISIVGLLLQYCIIAFAVSAGMSKTNKILERQNELLSSQKS